MLLIVVSIANAGSYASAELKRELGMVESFKMQSALYNHCIQLSVIVEDIKNCERRASTIMTGSSGKSMQQLKEKMSTENKIKQAKDKYTKKREDMKKISKIFKKIF